MKNSVQQQSETSNSSADQAVNEQQDGVSMKRREAIKQIAKKTAYVAPATLALLSLNGRACSTSISC